MILLFPGHSPGARLFPHPADSTFRDPPLAARLLYPVPVNKMPTPLPEILVVLESITKALRSRDLEQATRLQSKALELLHGRPLDCGDRMILEKVFTRIRKAACSATVAGIPDLA